MGAKRGGEKYMKTADELLKDVKDTIAAIDAVKAGKVEEKKEEKAFPGIHKKIEKEAGLSDMAGKALGGLAGAATKAQRY